MGLTFREEKDRRNTGLPTPALGARRVRADGSKYDGHTYEVEGVYDGGIISLRWLRPDGTLTPRFRDGGPWILVDLWRWHNQFIES